MTSERERVAKAFNAMKKLGINVETVKAVLKKLLKLYDRKWELIEEENYRTLADAIFEHDEEKLKSEKKDANEDVEPPFKKPHRGQPEEQVSSTSNVPDLKEGEIVPNSSSGLRMVESSQSFSGIPTIDPRHHREASSGSKQKDPIILNSPPDEENSSTRPGTSALQASPKISDITNGTEKVKISLLSERGSEDFPGFVYTPHSITYESAYVHVSLARIADDECCPECMGDCLTSSIPCSCARETGGEFAYTPEGLLSDKFLRACISIKLAEESQEHLFYCQDCPLERAKTVGMREKCKGHRLRKFIKECWRKCGCHMQCGNRVVQRGISRNLQVFLTGEGKGWGLRTLEELPAGAFICEYAGEILTNIELYERNLRNSGKDKHVYPVLLDADWATEGVLKDEEALCLDATHYGNVARFINHRFPTITTFPERLKT